MERETEILKRRKQRGRVDTDTRDGRRKGSGKLQLQCLCLTERAMYRSQLWNGRKGIRKRADVVVTNRGDVAAKSSNFYQQ